MGKINHKPLPSLLQAFFCLPGTAVLEVSFARKGFAVQDTTRSVQLSLSVRKALLLPRMGCH